MKFKFYVYQRQYNAPSENTWRPNRKLIPAYSTFYYYFNKDSTLSSYFIDDTTVETDYCYDNDYMANRRSAHLITLKIPFWKKKDFKLRWTEFKSGQVSKYFYIKEK